MPTPLNCWKQFLSANRNRVVDPVRFGERLQVSSPVSSSAIPTTLAFEFAASSFSSGISVIHGVHQEAQKFKTTISPFSESLLTVLPSSDVSEKSKSLAHNYVFRVDSLCTPQP